MTGWKSYLKMGLVAIVAVSVFAYICNVSATVKSAASQATGGGSFWG